MDIQKATRNFWKIFGLVYLIINGLIFAVMTIMMTLLAIKVPESSTIFVLLLFPLLGVFTGYWIRTEKYNWWRIILSVLSFLFFIALLFIALVIGPELKNLKTLQAAPKADAFEGMVTLDGPTQRFFTGVYASDMNTIKEYLDQGVNVNAVNEGGSTALHITQNKEIIKLLISRGGDVNARDEYQMTPIFNKEVAQTQVLVEAGADVHARSEKGNTPLMWYCYSGYLEGVKYMISRGADVNVKNVDGQTAYDIAETFGHSELLEYLKSVGAKTGR